MSVHDATLLRKIKEHKRWMEKYTIQRESLRLNSWDFYLVFYSKFNRHAGFAVFSPQEDAPQEFYEKAFDLFPLIVNTRSKINTYVAERARISMDMFTGIAHVVNKLKASLPLTAEEQQIYEKIEMNIEKILQFQNELKQLMAEYKKNYMPVRQYTEEDVMNLVEVLAAFDYYIYNQAILDYENTEHLMLVKDHLHNNSQLRSLITRKENNYLNWFTSKEQKEKLAKAIESIRLVEKDKQYDREEHIKTAKQVIIEEQLKANEALKKESRFPVFV